MPNPKRRHTRTRTATRRAHDALTPAAPTACPQCRQPKLSHRVCPHCGRSGADDGCGCAPAAGDSRWEALRKLKVP